MEPHTNLSLQQWLAVGQIIVTIMLLLGVAWKGGQIHQVLQDIKDDLAEGKERMNNHGDRIGKNEQAIAEIRGKVGA